ncbi:MAG TPA: SprB repeat-containing protein, partial [Chitinophagales bacterium]|nr:SprB repeat-containing protein [Chitinophagales bacterium]
IFPDGTTSNATNPSYTFDSCGAFDVMMIVQNQSPCCSYLGDDTVVHRVYVDCTPFAYSNDLGDNEPYIHESFATVSVTAGSCAGDTTHFLIVPDGPIVNWVWTFPDSSISFSATPSYVYNACPPAVNYTTVTIFTNRGCVGYIDSLTGIFCPSNIGLSSTQTLCTGQCSGTATTTLSGGTPPYTVQWSDPGNQTTQTATNLCPGNYSVTITDGNGCTATPNQPVTVNDFPYPLASNVAITGNVRCYGWAGGSALLQYTGGTPPYSSFWSNGATTDTVSGLLGGTHSVTVTDAHGCTLTTQVNIPQPPPVLAPVTPVNATCNVCNGSATVNPNGGNGVYTYQWLTTPQQTTPSVNGLCAGLYTVIVEDANVSGCRDTTTFAINEIGAQPISASSTNATCYNLCNGTGTVTLTGGCLSPPCTISWLDSVGTGIGQSTATAANLCAGNYVVNVTNGAGCTSFANLSVNVPNPVTVTATATINTCGANCNGTITATASSGIAPYSYQWLDSTSTPIAGQTGSTINNVCAGTYFVRVTDGQGCIATAPVSVYQNTFLANATGSSVLCNGDCTGIITTVASAGTAPYTYTVQSGATTIYTGSSFITANLCAGNYTVIATDAAGCPVNMPVSIGQPP